MVHEGAIVKSRIDTPARHCSRPVASDPNDTLNCEEPGKVVKLTRNEVRHNQEPCTWETKCDAQVLFVVSGVTVTNLTPLGGEMGYAWPWKIAGTVLRDGDLDPTEFDYTVPELTAAAF
jgi:hypothetical protein